jgi:hypothetical protein
MIDNTIAAAKATGAGIVRLGTIWMSVDGPENSA